MFKRYMIVLTVLSCLTAALTVLYIANDTRQQEEYASILTECAKLEEGTKEWDEKCGSSPISNKEMQFTRVLESREPIYVFARYTGYILLLMLVSGVLRWIWNGKKNNR